MHWLNCDPPQSETIFCIMTPTPFMAQPLTRLSFIVAEYLMFNTSCLVLFVRFTHQKKKKKKTKKTKKTKKQQQKQKLNFWVEKKKKYGNYIGIGIDITKNTK